MHEYNAEKINYYFSLAAEQYEEIELVFELDLCPYSQASALCVGVKNGHFIARATLEELEREPLIWGTEVNGFFSVRDVDLLHFHFRTRLARLYNAPPNAMFLVCPLPSALDTQQRRFGKRVNLDESAAASLTVWHSYLTGGDAEAPPRQMWQPLTNRGAQVGEISANGMRLDISQKDPLYPRIFINDPALLRGDFGTPAKPAPLFILASVVRKMAKPESEDMMSIGCKFISWRKVDSQGAWFRADPQEGIGQLAQWISRNFHTYNS